MTSLDADLIFIDDDMDLIIAWTLSAKIAGKKILAYQSIDSFKKDLPHLNKKSLPVYIDSDFGEGIKGQEFAMELYEKGFTNIYLSTGYPKNHFGNMPWIREIVTKNPPF